MAFKKTPGVYVEEISTLPPSVAEVATAIPAFIGYTEITDIDPNKEVSDPPKIRVKRISTMLEYKHYFGGPPPVGFTVTSSDAGITLANEGNGHKYILYYSLKLYFENGGGPCYIASIGGYNEDRIFAGDDFIPGLTAIGLLDEPTLLVFPDAANLDNLGYKKVCEAALKQCQELGDRFTILDVKGGREAAGEFRDITPTGTHFLKYAAAYTPFLDTLLTYELLDENVKVVKEISEEKLEAIEIEVLLPQDSSIPLEEKVHFLKIKYTGAAESAKVIFRKRTSVAGETPAQVDDLPIATFTPSLDASTNSALLTIELKEDSTEVNDAFIKLAETELEEKDFTLDWPTSATRLTIGAPPSGSNSVNIRISETPIDIPTPANAADPREINIPGDNSSILKVTYSGAAESAKVIFQRLTAKDGENLSNLADATFETSTDADTNTDILTISVKEDPTEVNEDFIDLAGADGVVGDFTLIRDNVNNGTIGTGSGNIPFSEDSITIPVKNIISDNPTGLNLKDLIDENHPKNIDTGLYNKIKQELSKRRVELPPSPALAGIYARVDRTNGVWKTPANVSVMGIVGPTHVITNQMQEDLNIDATSGKSINAIRSFTGKGTLVWGGRTLAGNDNE
ncbi:MAG: hypothetical protein AB8F94_18980, partial [Saprospiraceae bacterium]